MQSWVLWEAMRLSRRAARNFARNARGSAAIEFALIAPAFFLILFAMIETGIAYFANSAVEKAAIDAARLVRTGQVQSEGMTKDAFRTFVCDRIQPFLACDSHLLIEVRASSQFAGSQFINPINSQGEFKQGELDIFQPGGPGEVVLVRIFYTWDLFTPLFSEYFANMATGQRLLSATIAFRNEPFASIVP